MIAALMLYSLVLGALLALGASVLDRTAVGAALPRRWTWAGALALLIGLTIAASWRSTAAVDGTGFVLPEGASSAAVTAPIAGADGLLATLAAGLAQPVTRGLAAVAARIPEPADRALMALWLLVSVAATGITLVALRRLDRQRRRWPYAMVHGEQVRVSSHEGPAVYGVVRPDIVLPSGILRRTAPEQQVVIAHEDEHRKAHDPLLLALAAFAVALVPFNPFAWWFAARLRLAVELDCDRRVLSRGTSARHYGEALVALAEQMSPRRGLLPALSLIDSRSHLERRLLAMTSRPARRTPLHLALFTVLCGSVVAAACNTDMPTAAQIEEADVAAVTSKLALPEMGANITYYVDGTLATAEMANALTADRIATVEVRGKHADGAGAVYIVTKDATNGSTAVVAFTADTLFVETPDTKRVSGAGNVRVSLRGSVNASAGEPLLVVDGVIQQGSKAAMSKIDPNTIASIEVLKGASGQSAFGDRGANGVIVIRTKK